MPWTTESSALLKGTEWNGAGRGEGSMVGSAQHAECLTERQRAVEGEVVSMRQGVSPPHLFGKLLGKCKLVSLVSLDP